MKKLSRNEMKNLMGGKNEPADGACRASCGQGSYIAIYCPHGPCVTPPNGVGCAVTGQYAYCPETVN